MNFHVSREGQLSFLYYCYTAEFKTARKVFATDDYYCFAMMAQKKKMQVCLKSTPSFLFY